MQSLESHKALFGWEPVNSRFITAKFSTTNCKIKRNIIQCYATTDDVDNEKKDTFYQLDKAGKNDMTILMGDFIVKIGADNTGHDEVMGTRGLGLMKENGERFANLCPLNQLVIGGSIFYNYL